MLVSFRQTYGDNRTQLLDIYSKDKKLHELLNQCDINIFSFHNSSEETIKYFEDRNNVKDSKILKFQHVTYGQCIQQLLCDLKEMGCTHFIFTQDDTFSKDNDDIDWNEFISFVKTFEEDFMYCYFYTEKWFEHELPVLKELKNLTIYENNTLNYAYTRHGGMNDYPYICTFDVLDKIYTNDYFSCGDIWRGEGYLTRRFSSEKMTRHNGNKMLFDNYNIIGKNVGARNEWIKQLTKKGIY